MKGKIPPTEIIILESSKDQWNLFAKGLIKSLTSDAIIQRSETSTVKIKIDFTFVSPPNTVHSSTQTNLISSTFSKNEAEGLRRAKEFFENFIDKKTWIIGGLISGENKTPIIIMYYENINIAVYAIKLTHEEISAFFPPGTPSPSMN